MKRGVIYSAGNRLIWAEPIVYSVPENVQLVPVDRCRPFHNGDRSEEMERLWELALLRD